MNTDGKPETVRARLLGKEIASIVMDELGGAWIDQFFQDMTLWTSHRARNLSHRPVAGARKRKAALKYAARQHRAVVRFS